MDFKLFKNILIIAMVLISLALLNANLVLAAEAPDTNNKNSVLNLLRKSGDSAKYNVEGVEGGDISMASVVGQIIQIFLSLLGAIFVGLMIYGGYEWMMARGSSEQVDKAKDTIKNSIIGLIIVIAAYAISYFVLYYLTQGYFDSGTSGF